MRKATTTTQKKAVRPVSKPATRAKKTKKAQEEEIKKLTLEERAAEIKRLAEESGLADDFYFLTTFDRYETQIKILAELKKTIEAEDTLIEKEYVKGRKNLYTHPAISEYNRTTDSANKTVTCLLKILEARNQGEKEEEDPLLKIMGEV